MPISLRKQGRKYKGMKFYSLMFMMFGAATIPVTKPEVQIMCGDDQAYRNNQKDKMIFSELFCRKEYKSD